MIIYLNRNNDRDLIAFKDCGYDIKGVFANALDIMNGKPSAFPIMLSERYCASLVQPKRKNMRIRFPDEYINGWVKQQLDAAPENERLSLLKAFIRAGIAISLKLR